MRRYKDGDIATTKSFEQMLNSVPGNYKIKKTPITRSYKIYNPIHGDDILYAIISTSKSNLTGKIKEFTGVGLTEYDYSLEGKFIHDWMLL